MRKTLNGIVALVLAFSLLAGCATGTKKGEESTSSGSVEWASSSVTAETKKGEVKSMALILSGPANDQGWNAVAVDGMKAVAEKYGLKTTMMENVSIADSESAYRQLAAEGYDVIIGHGYQFGEPAAKIAAEFPEAYFLATEANSKAENMSSYVMACEQGAYIMGMVCAGMSKSETIGVMGGMEQPSIIKEVEAFKLGAAAVNPKIKVLSPIYLNTFTDTNKGYEAAMSLIGEGADVIYHIANQAGNGAIKACEEKNVLACGNAFDQNAIAPKHVVSSTIYNMDQVMLTAVGSIVDGTFKGDIYNLGMDKKVVEIAPYHDFDAQVPAELKAKVSEAIEQITSGKLVVPVIQSSAQ